MPRHLTEKETYDFWFNNKEFNEHDQFGSGYYVNDFYTEIVSKLDIPNKGYIVVAGTHKAISFNLLCKIFGSERCIGFDLYNPSNHPRVFIKNCLDLSDIDNVPIAFAHNDVGSLSYTPEVKIHTHKWLSKNIVPNGYILGNNNLNRAKFKFEEFMKQNDFTNTNFKNLDPEIYNLSQFPEERIEGYMLSRKNYIGD